MGCESGDLTRAEPTHLVDHAGYASKASHSAMEDKRSHRITHKSSPILVRVAIDRSMSCSISCPMWQEETPSRPQQRTCGVRWPERLVSNPTEPRRRHQRYNHGVNAQQKAEQRDPVRAGRSVMPISPSYAKFESDQRDPLYGARDHHNFVTAKKLSRRTK